MFVLMGHALLISRWVQHLIVPTQGSRSVSTPGEPRVWTGWNIDDKEKQGERRSV